MPVHDTSLRAAWNYELTLKDIAMGYLYLNMFEVNGTVTLIKNKCSEAKFENIDHSTSFNLDDLETATFVIAKYSFSPMC